jgi:predicted pyridoxine 5'-phosphate oxidase superfamily flavin-nucleotide-binding protein
MEIQSLPEVSHTHPFHPGERVIQLRAGVREEAETRGRSMLTADLATKQREFFHQRTFVVTGHCDGNGQPWAGLITGAPGFMRIEESSNKVFIRWSTANNLTNVEARPGNSLGMLGIDFETRRRNRLNATVFAQDANQWRMVIDQGYGNCPKYIQQRSWHPNLFVGEYRLVERTAINTAMEELIKNTDTFFIASSSGPELDDTHTQSSAWGGDISHRGGEAGFL